MSNIQKHNTGRVPWLSVGKFLEDPYVDKFNNLDPWKMKMLHLVLTSEAQKTLEKLFYV